MDMQNTPSIHCEFRNATRALTVSPSFLSQMINNGFEQKKTTQGSFLSGPNLTLNPVPFLILWILPVLALLCSLIKVSCDTLKYELASTLKLYKCVGLYSDEKVLLFSFFLLRLVSSYTKPSVQCFPWQNKNGTKLLSCDHCTLNSSSWFLFSSSPQQSGEGNPKSFFDFSSSELHWSHFVIVQHRG